MTEFGLVPTMTKQQPLLYAAVFLHSENGERIQRLAQHTRYSGDQGLEFVSFVESTVLADPMLLRRLGERHAYHHFKVDNEETRTHLFEIQYMFDEQSNMTVLCVSKYGCGSWRHSAFIVEALDELRENYPPANDSIADSVNLTERFGSILRTRMQQLNGEEDEIDRLALKVERWREALHQTIQKLEERGDNVDILKAKIADLEEKTKEFKGEAESLASQGWWHSYAGTVGGVLALAILL